MAVNLNPTPNSFLMQTATAPSVKTKSADPSIILFDDDAYPSTILQKLIFEEIAGQELLSLVRTTNLSGIFVSNNIVSNANELSIKYNPSNIVYIPDSLANYFKSFKISLADKNPQREIELFVRSSNSAPNLFFDLETKSLTAIVKDTRPDEQVEFETANQASVFDDTIDVNYAAGEFSIF